MRGSGTPVDRSRASCRLVPQGPAVALATATRAAATVVPRRPSVRIAPERASSCQAALTVVGESLSSSATRRIGGSWCPGARAPSRMARLHRGARPSGGGLVQPLLERGRHVHACL